MNINQFTIKQAQAKLETGEITSVDLTRACLDRIKEVDGRIHACLTVCEKQAMREARIADERRAGGDTGDLLGIPYLAKDNIMIRGVKTTAASKILEKYTAPYDATIIKKLKQAGAVLLGKTNLDEFAHGVSTENSAFGPTHNPHNLDYVPGGSSGGSAAAVASDMCIFALGTDTGGSIRHPASYCGITGLKPTYGLCSRFGLVAMTSSTDVPGPLTKTAEDARIVLDRISGRDEHDASTTDGELIKLADKKIKIGLPKEFFSSDIDKKVVDLIRAESETFKNLNAEFVEVSLPLTHQAVNVYYIITPSEISSNLARFDGIRYGHSNSGAPDLLELYTKSRGEGFGPEAKRRIMLGTYVLSAGYFDAYYLRAQKVRTRIIEEFDEVFKTVDLLLTPTTIRTAFKLGEKSHDPLKMYLEDLLATSASLAGLPAISIPAGLIDNMPIGMQLIGPKLSDLLVLDYADKYQQKTTHHQNKPHIS